MHTAATAIPRWSTACFGAADASTLEISALGSHLRACSGSQDRWFGLRCLGRQMRGFMAARFVTTAVLLACLVGCVSLIA